MSLLCLEFGCNLLRFFWKKNHTDDVEVLKAHKKKCIKFYTLGRVNVRESATAIFLFMQMHGGNVKDSHSTSRCKICFPFCISKLWKVLTFLLTKPKFLLLHSTLFWLSSGRCVVAYVTMYCLMLFQKCNKVSVIQCFFLSEQYG